MLVVKSPSLLEFSEGFSGFYLFEEASSPSVILFNISNLVALFQYQAAWPNINIANQL